MAIKIQGGSFAAINLRAGKKRSAIVSKTKVKAVTASNSVLGQIISEAMSAQLLTVRSAARRVGMSPSQISRVVRGLYGVRSVHLAKLIVGLNLSAEDVVSAIYAESRQPSEPA